MLLLVVVMALLVVVLLVVVLVVVMASSQGREGARVAITTTMYNVEEGAAQGQILGQFDGCSLEWRALAFPIFPCHSTFAFSPFCFVHISCIPVQFPLCV